MSLYPSPTTTCPSSPSSFNIKPRIIGTSIKPLRKQALEEFFTKPIIPQIKFILKIQHSHINLNRTHLAILMSQIILQVRSPFMSDYSHEWKDIKLQLNQRQILKNNHNLFIYFHFLLVSKYLDGHWRKFTWDKEICYLNNQNSFDFSCSIRESITVISIQGSTTWRGHSFPMNTA